MESEPVIVIDDDQDDLELIESTFVELNIPNKRIYLTSSQEAYDLLLTIQEQPFLIISDVNLPGMSGPDLKKKINENPNLKKKAIPFIFLTTSSSRNSVDQAYSVEVQGYFVKPEKFEESKKMITLILDYWAHCLHPNRFR